MPQRFKAINNIMDNINQLKKKYPVNVVGHSSSGSCKKKRKEKFILVEIYITNCFSLEITKNLTTFSDIDRGGHDSNLVII